MKIWLDAVDERYAAFTRRVAFIGVLGMLVISLLTAVDITLRAAFNSPMGGFNEIVEMVMAVAIAATFPAGLAQRVHLNIDLMGNVLSPAVRAWLKPFGSLVLMLLFILFAWRIGVFAHDLDMRNQVLMVLQWPVAPFLYTISGLLVLCLVAQFFAMLVDLRDALAGIEPGETHFGSAEIVRSDFATARRRISGRAMALLGILVFCALTLCFVWLGEVIGGVKAIVPADSNILSVVFFAVLWVLILILVPLAGAMGLIGFVGSALILGLNPALNAFGSESVEFLTNINIAVLPLFLMMGSFASVAGLSSDVYNLAHALLGYKRGGLALATIGGCAGFGALTGSSMATAVTIGRVALPEMKERGYAAGLSTGCIAAGGTLGQLVPPSAPIVIYALLVEESIGRLFIAAMIPAAVAVVLYMLTIWLFCKLRPDAAPEGGRPDIHEILKALRNSWGAVFLFLIVIGGIYGGIFTVNEAAAVGAGGAFLFALFRGKLSGGVFWEVMGETTATTAMIYTLILGAINFSFFMGITGLSQLMTSTIGGLEWSPIAVIALLLVIYLILGAIMDPFAMMVITVPIVAPLVTDMGYDLIWWGIIMVCVVETGLITPPFGINVFVLKGVAPDVPLGTVFKGVLPFVLADIVKLVLLVAFPALILWLPSTMVG